MIVRFVLQQGGYCWINPDYVTHLSPIGRLAQQLGGTKMWVSWKLGPNNGTTLFELVESPEWVMNHINWHLANQKPDD